MNSYKLLKFKPIDKYLISSLVTSSLYFSSPDKLNDPFDCKIDIKKALMTAAYKIGANGNHILFQMANDSSRIGNFIEYMSGLGVCSFSITDLKKYGQTLMWSHYAHNHEGVCIEYNITKEFLEKNNDHVMGIADVVYEEDFLINAIGKINSENESNLWIDLAKIFLMCKSPSWEYEQEARIVSYKAGNMRIPKDYISKITFGINTSDDDISLIQEIANKFNSNIKLFRSIKSSREFEIEYTEID